MVTDTKKYVDEFAEAMEATLQKPKNAAKPPWDILSVSEILVRLKEEIQEVEIAVHACMGVDELGVPTTKIHYMLRTRVQEEVTDVANFAMMIWRNIASGNPIE